MIVVPGWWRDVPSSLIFAALAGAWLVVLVPMIAKRRREVVRTADSALAARVLHRPGPAHHDEEESAVSDRTAPPEWGTGGDPPTASAPMRRFRPGRGGYDQDAAALAARARYAFRRRVVVVLLLGIVATVLLALFRSTTFWWAHAGLDACLVGYLAYLRRQVRIEDEVRRRRAARACEASRRPSQVVEVDEPASTADEPTEAPVRAAPPPPVHPGAVAVDLDDEDPAFDELDPAFEPPYRRAVGE